MYFYINVLITKGKNMQTIGISPQVNRVFESILESFKQELSETLEFELKKTGQEVIEKEIARLKGKLLFELSMYKNALGEKHVDVSMKVSNESY